MKAVYLHSCSRTDEPLHDAVGEGHELVLVGDVLLGAGDHHVALAFFRPVLADETVPITHCCVLWRGKDGL